VTSLQAVSQLRRLKHPRRPSRIIAKLERAGIDALTQDECCRLVYWQLARIYRWQLKLVADVLGGGGTGTPPVPPKWPPA
jgi:hypothetical protein